MNPMNANEHQGKTMKRIKTRGITPTTICRRIPLTMRIDENVGYAHLHSNSVVGNNETGVPF